MNLNPHLTVGDESIPGDAILLGSVRHLQLVVGKVPLEVELGKPFRVAPILCQDDNETGATRTFSIRSASSRRLRTSA